ncbi:MAG: ferredoxin, partial [Candidatus Glassbacteria bacterium]|nr:ferredoxin [Candidatus Glassbacteria bacterium]
SEKQLKSAAGRPRFGGCPGSLSRMFAAGPAHDEEKAGEPGREITSRLGNWPVQLNLAPLQAPYFDGATVLICADCVPFALAGFHSRFLAGKTLLIGCPKLDDAGHYLEKLTAIFSRNDIRAVEVLIMEVPCCSGLAHIVRQAVDRSGKSLLVTMFRVGIRGDVLDKIEAAPSAV